MFSVGQIMSDNNNKQIKYTGLNRLFRNDNIQILHNSLRDGSIKDFVDDWKWIFSYSKRYRWIVVFYALVGILNSTMSIGTSYVGRILINIVVGKQQDKLWILIIAMIGMLILSLVFSSVSSYINARISIYVNNDMQAGIFERIMDARWKELSSYPSGDLLNRFNGDVGTIATNAIGWIPNLIVNIYTFIVTLIVLWKMDIGMALIAFISAPFLLGLSRFIMRRMKEYRKRVLELNSQMMSFEVETFYNFEMIKSFGIFGYYSRKLKDWQQKYKKYNLDYNTDGRQGFFPAE